MSTYKVIGYGSLISHKSLKEDCKNKKFVPVIIKGYKRMFDIIEGKNGPDVLNVEKADSDEFNGVMFTVNEKELAELKEREDWYNIEESESYDFVTKKKIGKCYVFTDHLILIDKHHNNPDKKYFILCREAAYHISNEFGKKWDETTYTSSNEKISEWIKKHPDYDTLKN